MGDSPILSLQNEVFSKFTFYAAVLLLKMIAVSLWIAKHRVTKQVFISPEDYKGLGVKPKVTSDPDIERVRRCHANDLENIPVFILLAFLYVITQPDLSTATLLFRLFTGARILHTIVYINCIPQPARTIVYTVGLGVNIYLALYLLTVATY